MSRKLFVGLTALLMVLLALPAAAITNPTPDDGEHPQVGQLLFFVPDEIDPRFPADDPGAWFNCSGTVIADQIVLTAGHCTYGVGDDGASTTRSSDTNDDGVINIFDEVDLSGEGGNDIWFTLQEVVDYSFLPHFDYVGTACSGSSCWYVENSDNATRYVDWKNALNGESAWIRGTANPHPDYDDNAFFLHDAGIVELDDSSGVDSADYGQLPDEGFLDQFFAQRRNDTRFTPVGYGLQFGFPFYPGGDIRYQASVMLVDATGVLGLGPFLPGTAVLFSNSAGKAHQGGTCFGDSGGPVFYEDSTIIVAVTSFGINPTCTGVGGGYRIDQSDDLEFIGSYLP